MRLEKRLHRRGISNQRSVGGVGTTEGSGCGTVTQASPGKKSGGEEPRSEFGRPGPWGASGATGCSRCKEFCSLKFEERRNKTMEMSLEQVRPEIIAATTIHTVDRHVGKPIKNAVRYADNQFDGTAVRKPVPAKTLSIVIPALNEEEGIQGTIKGIPVDHLESLGYDVQILVVDNGSEDATARLAKEAGADVVYQPKRGYGSAYKAGFAAARGEIIATADADLTYPVEIIPQLAQMLEDEDLDFITTNRFANMTEKAMSTRNKIGNGILNIACRVLFGVDLKDSQSGMWVFRRSALDDLVIKSDQMPFSQELKIECLYYGKLKWKEVDIDYRDRVGQVKLSGWRDGFLNLVYMLEKRISRDGKRSLLPSW